MDEKLEAEKVGQNVAGVGRDSALAGPMNYS
jgi:hypothetical protein